MNIIRTVNNGKQFGMIIIFHLNDWTLIMCEILLHLKINNG